MNFLMLLSSKSLNQRFYDAFIKFDRWKLYVEGLENTLIIALVAILIGIFLGFIFAGIKYVNKKTGKLKILTLISDLYITVVRGTPVVLQMLIMFTVFFAANLGDIAIGDSVWINGKDILVGGLTFGLNSAAYVAEIVRAGFESVDDGQMEAGRTLGMSTLQTMTSVVTPQAFRHSLPPLFNEFICLVKETAIIGYVGVYDLGKIPDIIITRTFDTMPPLIISALMYLALVLILTGILKLMEKSLSKTDRNYKKTKMRGIFKKGEIV